MLTNNTKKSRIGKISQSFVWGVALFAVMAVSWVSLGVQSVSAATTTIVSDSSVVPQGSYGVKAANAPGAWASIAGAAWMERSGGGAGNFTFTKTFNVSQSIQSAQFSFGADDGGGSFTINGVNFGGAGFGSGTYGIRRNIDATSALRQGANVISATYNNGYRASNDFGGFIFRLDFQTVAACSPSVVANGTVAAAPDCTISCNIGFQSSGNSCIPVDPSCSPSMVANGTVSAAPDCALSCNSGYQLSGNSCTPIDSACAPVSVTNGTVAAYPACTISCNTGYNLSGSSCVATPTCSPASVANGAVAAYPACTINCNTGYNLSGSSCAAETTPPTCGSWIPNPSTWTKSSSQSFTLSGSTDSGGSGIATSGGTCSVTANSGTCSVTISDNAGNTTVCTSPTAKIDTAPPVLTTPTIGAFAANPAKTIVLNFVDALSGVASVSVTVQNPAGASQNYTSSSGTITFTHDFSKAKVYSLTYTICDAVANCDTQTDNNFFQAVADVPTFTSSDCTGNNYYLACPSSVSYSSGTKVADNAEYHAVTVQLVDQYGNPVISEASIKTAKLKLNFNNTTRLDQIAETGDSIRYVSSEFTLDKDPGGTTTDWLTEASSGDGNYAVRVYSYAPTSEGYAPIVNDGFSVQLKNLEYEVTNISSYSNVGETI